MPRQESDDNLESVVDTLRNKELSPPLEGELLQKAVDLLKARGQGAMEAHENVADLLNVSADYVRDRTTIHRRLAADTELATELEALRSRTPGGRGATAWLGASAYRVMMRAEPRSVRLAAVRMLARTAREGVSYAQVLEAIRRAERDAAAAEGAVSPSRAKQAKASAGRPNPRAVEAPVPLSLCAPRLAETIGRLGLSPDDLAKVLDAELPTLQWLDILVSDAKTMTQALAPLPEVRRPRRRRQASTASPN
jgi:hypothetical protein